MNSGPNGAKTMVASSDTGTARADDHDSGNEVWSEMFDADTRRQLIEDDREAWKLVVTLLLAIVICGLCLGFFGVFLSVYF